MASPKSDEPEAFEATLLAESGPRATPRPAQTSWERFAGKTFDHFELDKLIARGGMGAVYLARDRSLDRQVAIKVLPEELASEPALLERFIREARAQARLNSAYVVHIHHIGRMPAEQSSSPSLYFAMELVDGGSLERVIDGGDRLEPERARTLMTQVARGLRDAAEAGIIHRDIKPSNLLLDKNGAVKIADFGVAKPVGADSKITHDGMVVGSPLYMPPEQAKGLDVDHRADMYSLGCTFYHLLAGSPPYDGPTPLAVVSKHMTEPLAPLRGIVPLVPPRLAQVVERLMAKEASDRFDSYDDLILALEAAAPAALRPAGFWVRGAAVSLDVGMAAALVAVLGWRGIVLHLVYVTAVHALWGQTAGKYLMSLQVLRTDGQRIGWGRSIARTLTSLWMPFLTGLLILLTRGAAELERSIEHMQPAEFDSFRGFLIAVAIGNVLLCLLYFAGMALAAFHPQKRAAHDLIVGSQVVYRLR